MGESHAKSSEQFVQPYVFVLKEGKGIKGDFLDYSLLMLQVGQLEVIPSPYSRKSSTPMVQMLKK